MMTDGKQVRPMKAVTKLAHIVISGHAILGGGTPPMRTAFIIQSGDSWCAQSPNRVVNPGTRRVINGIQ